MARNACIRRIESGVGPNSLVKTEKPDISGSLSTSLLQAESVCFHLQYIQYGSWVRSTIHPYSDEEKRHIVLHL